MDKKLEEFLAWAATVPRVSQPETRQQILDRLAVIGELSRRRGYTQHSEQAAQILARESVDDVFRNG